MKVELLKKRKRGIFSKKIPVIQLPSSFIARCDNEDGDTIIHGYMYNPDTIVLSTKEDNELVSGYGIKFKETDNEVNYGKVVGFFTFRGDIFYRAKGVAAKEVKSGVSFVEFIKDKYPEDFAKAKMSEVSNLTVTLLEVTGVSSK